MAKKLGDKRSQLKTNKYDTKGIQDSESHLKQFSKESNIEARGPFVNKSSRSKAEKESNKKAPIKMTFMKTVIETFVLIG